MDEKHQRRFRRYSPGTCRAGARGKDIYLAPKFANTCGPRLLGV